MAQTIKLKRSNTASAQPTTAQLASGELAMNTRDGKVYMRQYVDGTNGNDQIIQISGSGSITTGTSDPSEDLEEGNLFYDTDDAVFKIYSSSTFNTNFGKNTGIFIEIYIGINICLHGEESRFSSAFRIVLDSLYTEVAANLQVFCDISIPIFVAIIYPTFERKFL